ncbi:Uma2 family endonuclease [Microtetraspora malaysiensis]|uniref:Uma2 family endonuclease n=1 Tax=Microtetraspora malaysiensis TaxID=161358 RepID=UPI003D904ED5
MSDSSELPGWAFPPLKGYTAADLDRIPNLPAHTELIDGSLVFVGPQTSFHARAVDLLTQGLRGDIPRELRARREMSLVLDSRQRPEPDVSVIRAEAEQQDEQTAYQAANAVLVIEVVSPQSEVRDRKRKPVLYAEAGIPHFWRVENQKGRPAVYVYEIDPATSAYFLTGIHHDRLKVSLPFEIDIDLTEIDRF